MLNQHRHLFQWWTDERTWARPSAAPGRFPIIAFSGGFFTLLCHALDLSSCPEPTKDQKMPLKGPVVSISGKYCGI